MPYRNTVEEIEERKAQELRFNIIGGSVSRAFGIADQIGDWPTHLALRLKGKATVQSVQSVGFLNPSSLLDYVQQSQECDVLIIHMGTSVGWPVLHAPFEKLLRPEHRHDAALHLPSGPAVDFGHSISRLIRHSLRNSLKIFAFPFRLYKPRQTLEDLEPAIEKALESAFLKASKVVWIQHRSLGYRRLFLERRVYQKYYERIISKLRLMEGVKPNFHLVELPDTFLDQGNYTLDGVHLSGQGHFEISRIIESRLEDWALIKG